MASSLKFEFVVLMCMALVGVPMVQAINCGKVVSMVASCIPPITQGGSPPPSCCNGMRDLLKMAATTADRQATCNCLKTAATGIPGFNNKNSAALPGKCGVNVPYKISTSTNCATIKF